MSFHVFVNKTALHYNSNLIKSPLVYKDFTEIYRLVFNKHEFQFSAFLAFSSESGPVLRGVVVLGGGGAGGAHLHPAAGFHPHHQGAEQEVRKEI